MTITLEPSASILILGHDLASCTTVDTRPSHWVQCPIYDTCSTRDRNLSVHRSESPLGLPFPRLPTVTVPFPHSGAFPCTERNTVVFTKQQKRAKPHVLLVLKVSQTLFLWRWPSWKTACAREGSQQIPRESPLPRPAAPHVSLEIFMLSAKYLPQIILYC